MQLKRLFLSLLVVILILSATALAASANDKADVVFSVDFTATENADGSLSAKPGDVVEVSVALDKNKGASKLEIVVKYDNSVFAPVVDEDGNGKVTINEELNFKAPSSYEIEGDDWYGVLFNDAQSTVVYRSDLNNKEVYTDEGNVMTLYFEVKSDIEACQKAAFAVNGVATKWNEKTNSNVLPVTVVEGGNFEVDVHKAAYDVIKVEPTCTAEGSITYSCPACDVEFAVVLDKLAHTWVEVPAVEATCTSTGRTAGEECSVCGTIKSGEVIPMVPHQLEIIPAVEPTYKESGWTEGTKCTVCGNIINAPTEIPAKSLAWLWISLGSVAVVGIGGGALAYFLISKKKKKA